MSSTLTHYAKDSMGRAACGDDEGGGVTLWPDGVTCPACVLVAYPTSVMAAPAWRREWSSPWPAYAPIDVTPPELREGLADSVLDGWAEPYPLPGDVPDWDRRQAEALIPFTFNAHGWPLNPAGRTGRFGRDLGRWGENQAADPIVVAGTGLIRRILLIKRSDVGQWAIPGGMVDPGETAPAALVRELREETGVDLYDEVPEILGRVFVEDRRNTDHAWVTSTVALYLLPEVVTAEAADDAADARWFVLSDLATMEAELAELGGLYPAHRALLELALERLSPDYLPKADAPAIACTLVHEHDPVRCAAPSIAELNVETACHELADIIARIDGSFEAAAEDRMSPHTALEQTRDRLMVLLDDLGGQRLPEPILASEDGCGQCGKHWEWTPWATEAEKAERRMLHAGHCSGALF